MVKLYANCQNAKGIFSEVGCPHLSWAAVCSLGSVQTCTHPLSLIFCPPTSPNDHKTGFPNALGLVPRYLFCCGMIIRSLFSHRGLSFQYQANSMILCHFPLNFFNYLKTKIFLYQSTPAMLKAPPYWNAINYMKELFIVSLNSPSLFRDSLLS